MNAVAAPPSQRPMRLVRLSLVFALLVSVGATRASAQSCDDGVRLFPAPGATVPTNVEFILEGVLAEQDRVTKLLAEAALTLLGGGEAIGVTVTRGWSSTMNRVAVKLKPKRALDPNTEYTLTLDRALPRVKLLNDTWGDNSARWRTGPGADTTSPKFTTRPAVSEGFYQRTRDGLTRTLKLRTQVNDLSASWLLISMQRARGVASKQQYFVPVEGEWAVIGHDACSGSFGFDDGRAYKLSVELFDAAGNTTKAVALELSAPRPTGPEPEPEKK
ncbi:MAG: hypothetical protein JNJ54_14950 [Myxococcaceae bacterium]|nr:hypothetical protein [Myxococcaceae bacterium]